MRIKANLLLNMNKLILSALFLLLAVAVVAQPKREMDLGAILSVEAQSSLTKNLNLSVEEELRLVTNEIGFDRSVTSLGLTYGLFDKKLRVGGGYAYMRLYNSKQYFENRHRYYVNLSYRHTFNREWSASLRSRVQGTWRDENVGSYSVNPKYVWRNRLTIEHSVFGKPFKPFGSIECSTNLNDADGTDFYRIRYEVGTEWRQGRDDYWNFFLRFDQYLPLEDAHTLSLGVSYKFKL